MIIFQSLRSFIQKLLFGFRLEKIDVIIDNKTREIQFLANTPFPKGVTIRMEFKMQDSHQVQ